MQRQDKVQAECKGKKRCVQAECKGRKRWVQAECKGRGAGRVQRLEATAQTRYVGWYLLAPVAFKPGLCRCTHGEQVAQFLYHDECTVLTIPIP